MSLQKNKDLKTEPLSEQIYHKMQEGYCCSESLVMATTEKYAPHIPQQLSHIAASGLCGGMGNKQGSCGVFTGGVVAIGLVLGDGSKKNKYVKKLSAQYQQQLEEHAGGKICHELLAKMGISNWNGSKCRQLSADGGQILQEILTREIG